MSRDAGGIYTLPPVITPVIPDTIISTAWGNGVNNDIAQALTESLDRSGRGGMLAPLVMGNYPINAVGPATQPTDAPTAKQVRDLAFNWLTNVLSDAGGNIYTATAVLNAAPINGTEYAFVPDKTNTGSVTLNINGAGAVPILSNGAQLVSGSFTNGRMLVVIYANGSYNLTSGGNSGVNSITTSDPQTLTASQPTPGNSLLTTHTNVSNGLVKLDAGGKIPPQLLDIEGLTLLGIWDASTGNLPPNGTVSGQYYVVNPGGNLNLWISDGAGGWVQQVVPVSDGDMLLWVSDAIVEPTGWYRVIRANANDAADIVNLPTPSFVATDLQAWIDQADSASGMLLANGSRRVTGELIGGSFIAGGAQYIGQGIRFNGSDWISIDGANTYGWARLSFAGGGFVEYVSATTTPTPGGIVTVAVPWRVEPNNVWSAVNLTVGGAPRQSSLQIDSYGAGSRTLNVSDSTAGVAVKVRATAAGNFIDSVRQNADGSPWPVAGVPFTIDGNGSDGALRPYLTISPDGSIQVGGNSLGNAGAIISTYKYFGLVNTAISLVNLQAIGVNAGSNLSAGITMADGQVCRVVVVGGGSITLPPAFKIPKGGAQWGAATTIIGITNAGGTYFCSFTPYDS
jgi:hypothetical protein